MKPALAFISIKLLFCSLLASTVFTLDDRTVTVETLVTFLMEHIVDYIASH